MFKFILEPPHFYTNSKKAVRKWSNIKVAANSTPKRSAMGKNSIANGATAMSSNRQPTLINNCLFNFSLSNFILFSPDFSNAAIE